MSSIVEIQRATAAHFGLTRAELIGRDQARRFAWPRQVGMAIAREDGHSFPKIARKFHRHHTTVLHAARAVHERGPENARDIAKIRADLALYAGALVDSERKARAARAIGKFCASLRNVWRPFDTGTRGTRGWEGNGRTGGQPNMNRRAEGAPDESSTGARRTGPSISP